MIELRKIGKKILLDTTGGKWVFIMPRGGYRYDIECSPKYKKYIGEIFKEPRLFPKEIQRKRQELEDQGFWTLHGWDPDDITFFKTKKRRI